VSAAPLTVPAGHPFGPQALPLGVVAPAGAAPRLAARVGEHALDLAALGAAGLLDEDPAVLGAPALNALLERGPAAWRALRAQLQELLRDAPDRLGAAARPIAEVRALLPVRVADYVDFYSSLDHATNLGRLFRPGSEPLLPNWRWLPVGYHGRAGTVVVSGTDVRRPRGQARPPGAETPAEGPSRRLDVEVEAGFVVGVPSALGEPVGVERALDHVFGVALLNDWSARDLQAWEYQPLGPLTGKSFATSLAAWVLPLEALAPFRVPAPAQEPEPLGYLREEPWAWDVALELELAGEVVSRPNLRHLYWTVAQQVAHLTVNGASLRVGDLLATGTISGPEREQRGSLIELTWGGAEPVVAGGRERTFLEDGDEVVVRGVASAPGVEPVGLAEVRGRVTAARSPDGNLSAGPAAASVRS
jgi:fumarylacetoacetase